MTLKPHWTGPIKTDLSVSLKDLNAEAVRQIILDTKDDSWAKAFVDAIVEDFQSIEYGHQMPERYTVRDLAVHAANRLAYYTARTNSTHAALHRMLDRLLDVNSGMEGVIPARVVWKEGDEIVREQIGKYDFHSIIIRDELREQWKSIGYALIPTNNYIFK